MEKKAVAVLICNSCDRLVRLEDTNFECPSLWKCPNESCGDIFVTWFPICPSCHGVSTEKLAEFACEDCEEEMEWTTAYECGNENCGDDGIHLSENEADECGK